MFLCIPEWCSLHYKFAISFLFFFSGIGPSCIPAEYVVTDLCFTFSERMSFLTFKITSSFVVLVESIVDVQFHVTETIAEADLANSYL